MEVVRGWGGAPTLKKNQLNKQTTKSYSFCNIISHLRLCLLSPLFFQMPSQDSHSSSSLASCAQFSSPAQHTFLGYITTHLPPHLKKKKRKKQLFSSLYPSALATCTSVCTLAFHPLSLSSLRALMASNCARLHLVAQYPHRTGSSHLKSPFKLPAELAGFQSQGCTET